MSEPNSFQATQYAFAAHIRDPQTHPLPTDVEDRRMDIYRELFFNNINGFLQNGFPVLHSILSEHDWEKMARDFFAHHHCSTPIFTEIAEEFLDYLQNERRATEDDLPFLLELAHYEWIEMAVSISDADAQDPAVDPNGDLLGGHPVISAVAQNLSYHFPVHLIGPEFIPQQASDELTHLVVYRNRQDEVVFLEINVVTQTLIQILKENPDMTGLDAVTRIAQQLQHPDPQVVIDAGTQLLYDLRHRDIIIGTAI
ncbi:MAG: putative DNA-binding domain-containing protein [Chromatiales bacterium]